MATSRCHGQSKRITGESFWNKPKDDGSTETPPLTISVTDTDTKAVKLDRDNINITESREQEEVYTQCGVCMNFFLKFKL